MHCVDLGESFPTHIYLQKSASIQPRTSPVKFARSPCTDPPGYMQQLLEKEGKTFLDSDHLQDLDLLIDTVRKDVDVLLVILSEDVFWRPWCMAEIGNVI